MANRLKDYIFGYLGLLFINDYNNKMRGECSAADTIFRNSIY